MMMLSICSSAVLLLLSAVPPFAHGSVSSCFSDLTDLQAAVDTKDPDTVVTYTLCPNTEYPIGDYAPPDFDEIVDGQSPLFLRKNSIIKCGDNGKDNGCILSGGIFQALVTTPSFDNEEKTNIVIKGLTFQGGINAGYLDAAAGDVTFVDCVIKDQFNFGAVSLLFFIPPSERALQENPMSRASEVEYYSRILEDPEAKAEYLEMAAVYHDDERDDERELQTSNRSVVTFEKCLFKGNSYGLNVPGLTNPGVIAAETDTNDVIIKNCQFEDNHFGDANFNENGFAVQIAAGSTLEITGTRFVDNEFVGLGPVIVDEASGLLKTNGSNKVDTGDETTCEFIALGTTNPTCV